MDAGNAQMQKVLLAATTWFKREKIWIWNTAHVENNHEKSNTHEDINHEMMAESNLSDQYSFWI